MKNKELSVQENQLKHVQLKPMSKREKKSFAATTYIWAGIFALIACIPLFNFIIIPFVGVIGLIGALLYSIKKASTEHTVTPVNVNPYATLKDENSVDVVEEPFARPGLISNSRSNRTHGQQKMN